MNVILDEQHKNVLCMHVNSKYWLLVKTGVDLQNMHTYMDNLVISLLQFQFLFEPFFSMRTLPDILHSEKMTVLNSVLFLFWRVIYKFQTWIIHVYPEVVDFLKRIFCVSVNNYRCPYLEINKTAICMIFNINDFV